MKWHNVKPIERREAEAALATDDETLVCDALLRSAFHDPDWQWVQERCLAFCRHPNKNIKAVAVTCIGHVARIHGVLDLERVLGTLEWLLRDPELSGRVQDALEDIKMFLDVSDGHGESHQRR